ncbi:hypothetical protein [Saliphagus infecundisoli]|uniref:Polyprenyl synthetase n=1 Tax=Saliphagus infecundisoli TaxID=1849069 RepID=A0ABD5QKS9_9EURY|nr:hypothetical protein [Saliphagus infecundisoli]
MREVVVGGRTRALSPAVERVVNDALDSRTVSLPTALTRASAEAVGDGGEPPGTDAASTAVASLSGYAHLRRTLLSAPDHERRAVALLASDYLLASAHAALGVAAVPPDRRRELYATLTAGSAELAAALFAVSTDRSERDVDGEPPVAATLAETGCALGAAVGAASRGTVEAMADYGRSLATAAARTDGEAALARIEAAVSDDHPDIDRGPAEGPIGDHTKRARAALEALPEGEARERLERATRVVGGLSSG